MHSLKEHQTDYPCLLENRYRPNVGQCLSCPAYYAYDHIDSINVEHAYLLKQALGHSMVSSYSAEYAANGSSMCSERR